MNIKMSHLKQATALLVVVTMVLCQSFVTGTPLSQVVSKMKRYVSGATGASTIKPVRLPAAAQLSVQGEVTLNGLAAPTGATVFSGGDIKTAKNSTAVLSFGQTGQVELASISDFTLAVEDTTLGGQLRSGRATFIAPAGVTVKVVTVDGPILADGREATMLTVDMTSGKTRVEAGGNPANVTTPAGVRREATAPLPAASPGGLSIGQTITLAGLIGTVVGITATAITLSVTEGKDCYSVNQNGTLSQRVPCPVNQ